MAKPTQKNRKPPVTHGSNKKASTPRRTSPRSSKTDDSNKASPEPVTKKQKLSYDNKIYEGNANNVEIVGKGKSTEKKKVLEYDDTLDAGNIHAGEDWSDGSEGSRNDDDGDDNEDMDDDNETSLTDELSQSKHLQNSLRSQKKYTSLTSAEITILSNFVRRTVFRRIKFINDGLMMKLLPEIFDKLNITKEDDQTRKTSDLIKFTKELLSSRRGYSTLIVCNKLRGKYFCGQRYSLKAMNL
jgi:hypothetical protein